MSVFTAATQECGRTTRLVEEAATLSVEDGIKQMPFCLVAPAAAGIAIGDAILVSREAFSDAAQERREAAESS